MSIFEDVTITWKGEEYIIPYNRVMGLIKVIESAISVDELVSDTPPRGKLASAYAAAIKYAGGRVTEEDVYSTFFSDGAIAIQTAIVGLVMMMTPPQHLQQNSGDDTKKKE